LLGLGHVVSGSVHDAGGFGEKRGGSGVDRGDSFWFGRGRKDVEVKCVGGCFARGGGARVVAL
jgi:hypothetical protein